MKLSQILEQDLLESPVSLPKTVDRKGLTQKEAENRLAKEGKNQLQQGKKIHPAAIFVNQYKDILTIILLISTAVSLFLGEYVEAIAIAVIVLMNGVMGFLQEYKTEKTLEALKNMAAPTAKVYRDGRITQIKATDVVRGDRILIEAGDRICADCVILESGGIYADESLLTGESYEVAKEKAASFHEENSLNRPDVLYMGTTVTKGHGEAVIIATGMNTQMGQIAHLLRNIEQEETQLQKKLAQLGKYIAVGCLVICAIVSITGILRGEPFLDMLITGVSLAVAAVPEGLPAIVTIALALAVGRMVKQNALVRKLHAVETLGCTNVICSDKTGTLTQNHMTAVELATLEEQISLKGKINFAKSSAAYASLMGAMLCNNAVYHPQTHEIDGEPTETALLKMGIEAGIDPEELNRSYRRVLELPFDSKRKCMSVLVESPSGKKMLFTKGAYDMMLENCTGVRVGGREEPISASHRNSLNKLNESMAQNALRVIGIACKAVGDTTSPQETGLTFLGLVGMIDPPRPEVKEAVNTCRKAGIRTVMITGDHKLTACAIARQIGIYRGGDRVLEGKELENLSDDALSAAVKNTTVFARVSPKHKLRIVTAFQKWGNIVAMTGDGVNDAPAVKQADIGVSMGKSGTDVTKEASDVILLDDNFATLVSAVKEGRTIYSNIRKFIRYLLSCNIGEVLTMFFGMLLGVPVVLLPIQILLVNLVTDGLPAIALGLEPPEPEMMSQKPRKKDAGIFSDGLLSKIVFRGLLIGVTTLMSFLTLYSATGLVEAGRTGAYFTLVVTQLINVFECKSERHSLLSVPFGNNKKLLGAVFVSLLVLLTTIYFPPLQKILSTVSLEKEQIFILLGYCLIPSFFSVISMELRRFLRREKEKQ